MKQPTVRATKTKLRQAILEWGGAEEGGMKPWRAIEKAITDLDQASRRDTVAYLRGLKP